MLAAPLDETEGQGVPESGGSADSEGNLISVGQREEVRDALPKTPDQVFHGGLAVARSKQAGGGLSQGGHGLGTDLGGAGTEPAVRRPELWGDDYLLRFHNAPYRLSAAPLSSPYRPAP